MTYKGIIDNIRFISENHPLSNDFQFGQSVYGANFRDNCYPLVYLNPLPLEVGEQITTYGFNLFYIDRLIDDESNMVDVQNAGAKFVTDLAFAIDAIDGIEVVRPVALTMFNERFSDECAGSFCELKINAINSNTDCNNLLGNVSIIESEQSQLLNSENNENVILE